MSSLLSQFVFSLLVHIFYLMESVPPTECLSMDVNPYLLLGKAQTEGVQTYLGDYAI